MMILHLFHRAPIIILVLHILSSLSITAAFSVVTPSTDEGNLKQSAEPKSDKFGGKGLFAITSVDPGSDVISIPASSLICSQTAKEAQPEEKSFALASSSSLVNQITKSLCPSPGKERNTWYLAVTLAVWRLCKTETRQTNLLGSSATRNIADLPWESAHWQQPMLWSDGILDEALEHCCQEHDNAPLVLSVCDETRERINGLSSMAVRLSGCIEPFLSEICGEESNDGKGSIATKEEKVNLGKACHEAISLIVSRTLNLPKSGRIALVPILDLANQSDNPNAEFEDEKSNGSPARLVAIRQILEGDEITISYGVDKGGKEKSASIFFAGYGFVPERLATSTIEGKVLRDVALRGQASSRSTLS